MRIVSRYVFRQAAGAFLLILLSLTGIVWIGLALRQLNIVTTQGQDAWMLLRMTTLALPGLMAVIAPFSLLVAVIHTLNRLSVDSELIVLTAAGATVWAVARPLLMLALLVSASLAFINHLMMPWSLQQLRTYIIEVRTDLLTQVMQPGRFSSPEANLTFHLRDRSANGDLLGLMVHDARDAKLTQSYLAERGQIIEQSGSAFIIMHNGHIVRRTSPAEPAQLITFDQYAIDLDRFEQRVAANDLKARERYLSQLLSPEPGSYNYKVSPGQFRAEIHERFSNPLYPIVFVLICVAAIGSARSTRQNKNRNTIVAGVASAAVRLGGLALNNVVTIKAALAPLMYVLPLVAILASLYAIRRAAYPRRPGRIEQAISAQTEALSEWLVRFLNLILRRTPAAAES